MKSETRSVAVVAGQHAAIEIHLMPDPQYFQEKLADARQYLSHGDAQGAIQISSELSSRARLDVSRGPRGGSLFLRAPGRVRERGGRCARGMASSEMISEAEGEIEIGRAACL